MNKIVLSFTGIVVLLLAVTVFSVTTGSIKVGGLELIQGLFTGTNKNVEVIKDLRLPRIIVALFVGASLAVSGVLLQAVMRSSLADAGVIGISSGAGFISVLFVTIFRPFFSGCRCSLLSAALWHAFWSIRSPGSRVLVPYGSFWSGLPLTLRLRV